MKNTKNIIIGLLIIGVLGYFFKCNICTIFEYHHGICASCNDNTHTHWHIKPIAKIGGLYYVEFTSVNSNALDSAYIEFADSTFFNSSAENIFRGNIGKRGDTIIWNLNTHK